MTTKKIVLTPEEKEIERRFERGEMRPVSKQRFAEIIAMAKRGVAPRGGARPGAGRKPLAVRRVQISCTVAPETARRLRTLAKKEGVSVGAVLDRLGGASKASR